MTSIRAAIFAAVLWGAAMAQNVALADTMPVNKDFSEMNLEWDGGQIVTYRGRWNVVVDQKGFIVVCGAGQLLQSNAAPPTTAWLRSVSITLNGKKIMKDMSFFTKVKSSADVEKAVATCKSSEVKAPRGDVSVQMNWPPLDAKF